MRYEVDVVNTNAKVSLMTARKQYHHGELRPALIDAALVALERDGELPSWRALARACGVSQSAPYRHFESLDALRSAVAAECFRRLAASIEAAIAPIEEPFSRLEAGCTAYVRFGLTHPAWYALMFSAKADAERHPETAEAGAAAFGTLVEGVARCGVPDPLGTAYIVWTAEHGLVDILRSGIHIPELALDADAKIERHLQMITKYVRAVARGEAR